MGCYASGGENTSEGMERTFTPSIPLFKFARYRSLFPATRFAEAFAWDHTAKRQVSHWLETLGGYR